MFCIVDYNFIRNKIAIALGIISNNPNAVSKQEAKLIKTFLEIGRSERDKNKIISDELLRDLYNQFQLISRETKYPTFVSWLSGKPAEVMEDPVGPPIDSVGDYVSNVRVSLNFIDSAYGESSAKSTMLRMFNSGIIRSIIVDLDNETEILNDQSTLNTKINQFKNDLYLYVKTYIEEETKLKLPDLLYKVKKSGIRENIGIEAVNKIIENSTNEELHKLYKLSLNPRTLSTWKSKAIGDDSAFSKKLNAYNAYFILCKFDSLLSDLFGKFITFLGSEMDQISASHNKYSFDLSTDANMTKTWQLEDIFTRSAYDLIPKHLQRFLESLEIINEHGKGIDLYLTKNHLTYFTKLIKRDFRKDNTQILRIFKLGEKSWDQLLNIIREKLPGLPESVVEDLALKIRTLPEDSDGNTILTIKNVVDTLRLTSELTLKTIFELRKYMLDRLGKQFSSKIELRLFTNLYNYLFAERHSLYSSSRYLYGELAQLFDTMSVVDHTQYRISEKGYITKVTLDPGNKDLLKWKRKHMINSIFVPKEMLRYTKKYGGTLNNKNEFNKSTKTTTKTREVSFFVKAGDKPYWHFTYMPLSDSWVMYRPSSKDLTKLEKYDPTVSEKGVVPERAKLTINDLRGLNEFIQDTLGFDFYNNREQWEALLDITNINNEPKTPQRIETLTRLALNNLLEMSVRIYANALMFRQDTLSLESVTTSEKIQFDKEYVYFEPGREGVSYYTTSNNKPYTKRVFDKREDTERDVKDTILLKKIFGKSSIEFKTLEELKELVEKNLGQVFLAGNRLYQSAIDDWYGSEKRDQVRENYVYEGVDIVSSKIDTEYMKPLLELEALITGATYKNQVDTAERTKIVVGGGSMLLQERDSRLERQKNDPTNPMSILYDYLQEGFAGNSFSREVYNRPDAKQNKDFTFKENFYSCFVADFLIPMYMSGDEYKDYAISFTEAVDSDKPNVPKLDIERGKIMSFQDAKTMIRYALGDAYMACFKNIEKDLKKLTKEYKTLGKTLHHVNTDDLEISLEDNFDKFNNWCSRNNIDPIVQLGRMVSVYNLKFRTKPLAIYENIHYCIDNKTGNFYVNNSFVESLLRYSLVDLNEWEKRTNALKDAINRNKRSRGDYNTRLHLEHQLANLPKTSKEVRDWNKILQTLKARYLETRKLDESKSEFEIESNIDYNKFIDYSNEHFIHNLLKNDVVLDMRSLEGEMQLNYCLDKITSGLDADLKNLWKSRWLSFYGDRMAFAYLKVKNKDTNLYEDTKASYQSEATPIPRPIQLTSRIDLHGLYNKTADGKIIRNTNNSFKLTKQLYYVIDGEEREVLLEINPLLKQYNLNHYYWTQLSSLATTGSHVWSDAKKLTRTLDEESGKWFDSVKRNVINSATMTQYRLGSIWGVPTEVNIAVVDDIKAICSDILGGMPKVKPYDGATFVNPFMFHWENYSLSNQVTGITKKPIVEFYDERLMADGLIKMASFALTNDEIRNSQWNARAMWKMTNGTWVDKDGVEMTNIDLTLGLSRFYKESKNPRHLSFLTINGITRNENNINNPDGLCYYDLYNLIGVDADGKPVYPQHRVVKEIVSFRKLDAPNTYEIITLSRDANTHELIKSEKGGTSYLVTTKVINSNYSFWKALGGSKSVRWNESLQKFEDSEDSIRVVAEWASKIRFDLNFKQDIYEDEMDLFTSDKFTSREKDLRTHDARRWFNPLKESDIHYIVTKGAIKKGAANINTAKSYHNDLQLNFYKIKLTQAGIQLDPEHEADQSTVSLMTQVISGLADRGYTNAMAEEVYKALANLSNLAIKQNYAAFKLAFTKGDRQRILELVTGLLVDELQQSTSANKTTNLAKALAETLIEKGRRGETLTFEDIKKAIPFSDASIFELLQSTVTSTINKKAIREKMFGSLAVLRPSHEIHKIFGTKRLGELTNFDELRKLQNNLDDRHLTSISQTEIGRCYKVHGGGLYDGLVINLADSDFYYLWKLRLANTDYYLTEVIYDFGEIFDFTNKINARNQIISTNNLFNYFLITYRKGDTTFQQIRQITSADDLDDLSTDSIIASAQKINLYGRNLGSYNIHMNIASRNNPIHINRYDLSAVQDARYIEIRNNVNKSIEKYKRENNLNTVLLTDEVWKYILADNGAEREKFGLWNVAYNTKLPELSTLESEKILLDLLNAITKNRNLQFYDKNGNLRTGKVANHSVTHFEAILPMIYASKFGIRKGDTLAMIALDLNFFFKRNLENYQSGSKPVDLAYDICVKRADGKHIYIKYGGTGGLSDAGYTENKLSIYKDPEGHIFRLNPWSKNERLHVLASEKDRVFSNSAGTEVIVTDNLEFYIKNLDYTGLYFSNNAAQESTTEVITKALSSSNNRIAKFLNSCIQEEGMAKYLEDLANLDEAILNYMTSNDKKAAFESLEKLDNKIIKLMSNLSKKQHASFMESLKFTVARIPAQGMQSFMAMDIVGFNNTGVNDCYVSAEQIRLQGSDYDIDKATFLGHAFNKSGLFIKWSKHFILDSHEDLVASKVLPFPTGQSAKLTSGSQNSIDFSKYRSLFYDATSKKEKALNQTATDAVEKQEQEEASETSTKYKLKYHRNLKLLAQLINEINEIANDLLKDDPENTEFTLEYNNEDVKDLAQAITDVVNEHNLYLNTISVESRSDVLKNFIASRVFEISEHPANALVGGVSVDVSAQPLKDLADTSNTGNKPSDNRPGDVSIYFSALNQNQGGKDVIGITASNGLKCFFGRSQVINSAIRKKKNLAPYRFNVSFFDRINKEDNSYHFIANPFLDLNTDLPVGQRKVELAERLAGTNLTLEDIDWLYNRYENLTEWAGSYLSGILTLATDNAKELKLDRINAGKDLAGLYLYGIQIGIPIKLIFATMTSTSALVISRNMKTNEFTYDDLFGNILDSIDYIKENHSGILRNLRNFGSVEVIQNILKERGLTIDGLDYNKSRESLILLGENTGNEIKLKSTKDTIIEMIETGQFEKYINRLKLIRDNVINFSGKQEQLEREALEENTYIRGYTWELIDAKRTINKYIHYAYDLYEIYTANKAEDIDVFADLNNIETLNNGYRELGVLRQLLGLNQGIKTKSSDKLKFYEDFATIIKNRFRDANLEPNVRKSIKTRIQSVLGDNLRINFQKFFTDLEYRKNVIEIYDDIKFTVNPLRIVTELPHFNAYLFGAFIDYTSCGISAKFRLMVDHLMPHIKETFSPRGQLTATYVRRALDFIDNIITNRWLIEQNPIIIPKNNLVFDADGNSSISDTEFSIRLGTREGNLTFLHWMNQEVIPRLKMGRAYNPDVQFGDIINTKGSDEEQVNTFLRDIVPNTTNKTFNRNNILVFALPIDMIPKSDVDIDKLSKYKLDFTDLNHYNYKISNSQLYNIVDLLFYYNLINFKNKGGDKSMTSLIEGLVLTRSNDTINNYFEFISELDRDYDLTPSVDFTYDSFNKFVAPSSMEMRVRLAEASKVPYFWNLNRDTLKMELYRYTNDKDAKAAGNTYLERAGYFPTNKPEPTIYPLEFQNIIELESGKPISITLPNTEVTAQLKTIGQSLQLELSDIKLYFPDGGERTLNTKEVISKEELTKLIQVQSDGNKYKYVINPVSLLIHISSKRRADNC